MSTRAELERKIAALPRGPGVYIFKDAAGETLYVGKAKSLRERVRSYFRRGGDGRPQVRFIEERVDELETISTRSEKEAFLLENNLIKKAKPRFNIRLKDDKAYLHLRIDAKHDFPAIVPVRRPRKDGAEYFGPYTSARAIRTTLRVLRGVYPLRDCSDHELANRSRPCLKYQIKTCCAPCVGEVDREQYRAHLDGARKVLRGETAQLEDRLREEMQRASDALDFERAAVLRDRLGFLRNATETQAVETERFVDRDVVGLHRRGRSLELVVLLFRSGKLLSAHPFSFRSELPDDEALAMFLGQYYHAGRPAPGEVLLPTEAYGSETLADILSERRGAPVAVRVPRQGEGRRSVEMACRNAELSAAAGKDQESIQGRVLEEVQERLGLARLPRSIECVDVSHLQGSHAVASLVRFDMGEPDKESYRRYRIELDRAGDDYASVREVVRRRFGPRSDREQDPDLLLIDGGRGQLNAAREALAGREDVETELGGMAKAPRRGRGVRLRTGEEERIFRPSGAEIRLSPETEACYLLQRVRDEAHRFAVAYHRRLRSRANRVSILEEVDGLGPRKAKALLLHFGGLKELKAASREQLESAPGVGGMLAERIWAFLHPSADPS